MTKVAWVCIGFVAWTVLSVLVGIMVGRSLVRDIRRQGRRERRKKQPMRHRRSTVLIVDEDPEVREFYRLELADRRYEVVAAGDVDSVNRIIAASEPDVVLLDPYFGGKYRWDVLAGIKEQNSEVHILLSLAFKMFEDDDLRWFADGYFVKSFCTADLISRLESLRSERRTDRSSALIRTLGRQ